MKISVIVPAYNASQYIKKCVDSILAQTFKNLEVILIDDGSSDETPMLCDELAAFDSRVTVIHKANGGPSLARQAGVAAATGEYLAFVDADDYVDSAMFYKLFDYAAKEDADIVQCGYVTVSPEGIPIKEAHPDAQIIEGNYSCVSSCAKGIVTDFLWDKLFKAKLFEGVTFPQFFYSEDACIMAQLFSKSGKVVIVDELLYYHAMSPDGLCRKDFSVKSLDTVKAGEFLYDYYANRFPELTVFPKAYICSHAARNYGKVESFYSENITYKSQIKAEMLQKFDKYYDFVAFTKQRFLNNISFNRWIFISIFKFSPKLCVMIFRKFLRT